MNNKKIKIVLFILSLFFVAFSFTPSLYEIYHAKDLPKERAFVLEHNYMFDYNFYLSRIRQGREGRWLVVEKYYNLSHVGSLFQIVYLYLGKAGSVLNLSPPTVYHAARLLMGLMLLVSIGRYVSRFFPGRWGIIGFLIIITSGSWPILIKVGNAWRFATHMGWWSAIDSLQRITFIPHVLVGQIFILVFLIEFCEDKSLRLLKLIGWGIMGFIAGIIFPPALIVIYTVFGVLSIVELFQMVRNKSLKLPKLLGKWMPRIVFILLSFPSLIYLSLMLKIPPWSALALFDVQHRIILPYREYALALGPVLPLAIAGICLAIFKKEKKFTVPVVWILSIAALFFVFEKVPQQSPSRFTEALLHVPLGMMTTYLFWCLWETGKKQIRLICLIGLIGMIVMGLGVMGSMVFWLTDQAYGKRVGAWQVPIGAELAYPLKDFMDGIFYLRDHTPKNSVVLGYVTAGNFTPAYAGNYVYLGHANTPDEEGKEKIAARFFAGKMSGDEAKAFLTMERVSYIYFGPQEKEIGKIGDLALIYPFIIPLYSNGQVIVYRVL